MESLQGFIGKAVVNNKYSRNLTICGCFHCLFRDIHHTRGCGVRHQFCNLYPVRSLLLVELVRHNCVKETSTQGNISSRGPDSGKNHTKGIDVCKQPVNRLFATDHFRTLPERRSEENMVCRTVCCVVANPVEIREFCNDLACWMRLDKYVSWLHIAVDQSATM